MHLGIKFLQYLPTQAFQLSMKGLERPKDLLLDNYERTLVFGKKRSKRFQHLTILSAWAEIAKLSGKRC